MRGRLQTGGLKEGVTGAGRAALGFSEVLRRHDLTEGRKAREMDPTRFSFAILATFCSFCALVLVGRGEADQMTIQRAAGRNRPYSTPESSGARRNCRVSGVDPTCATERGYFIEQDSVSGNNALQDLEGCVSHDSLWQIGQLLETWRDRPAGVRSRAENVSADVADFSMRGPVEIARGDESRIRGTDQG